MIGLLTHTLQRIDSLQQFYQMELKSIERKAKDGMNKNRFAMLIEAYFQALMYSGEEYKKSDSFQALQKIMSQCIEIENTSEDENKKSISFTIKENKYFKDVDIDVKKGAIEYQKFAEMPQIHAGNTLIMLIIRFEEFISHFIAYIYSFSTKIFK